MKDMYYTPLLDVTVQGAVDAQVDVTLVDAKVDVTSVDAQVDAG